MKAHEFLPKNPAHLLESLRSMTQQEQDERLEYRQFVNQHAGGDFDAGSEIYAKIKNRPTDDIFGDAQRQQQFMGMKFNFASFSEQDWKDYWVMAQHCDHNRKFQQQALAIIKQYQGVDHHEKHYEWLHDRISCGLSGTQKYGWMDICGKD
jgi:hypothetical protein